MDKIITSIVIGGAVASIFGLSRTEKGKKFWQKIGDNAKIMGKKSVQIFGKVAVKCISFFEKK